MKTIKCKMCNANLEAFEEASTIKCSYCGTEQTLPSFYDNEVEKLYERADYLRKKNDYDGASKIYEKILEKNPEEAEAYWLLLLSEFGIEYVKDGKTGLLIPTINRMQYQSILSDENYKSACKYCDDSQRVIYESQATEIERIQKQIMATVQNEEPYDVFICYKETDHDRRTKDSVLANELYHELTEEGYRVFFARISLEDKLGQDYEPFIFSALNTAKVMVVLGTKPEYFQAVWVKNEWSRFINLINKGEKKQLIPVYRDIDTSELPEEFRTLQCMNVDDIGFMQDLIRGIKKIIGEKKKVVSEVHNQILVGIQNQKDISFLMEKAKLFLEHENYEQVDEICEDILNQDAHNGEAYLLKLMAMLKVKEFDSFTSGFESYYKIPEKQKVSLEDNYALRMKELMEEPSNKSILSKEEIDQIVGKYYPSKFYYYQYIMNEQQRENEKKISNLLEKCKCFCDKDVVAKLSKTVNKNQSKIKYDEIPMKNQQEKEHGIKNCEEQIQAILAEIKVKEQKKYLENEKKYQEALSIFESLRDEYSIRWAYIHFCEMATYKDSSERAEVLRQIIEKVYGGFVFPDTDETNEEVYEETNEETEVKTYSNQDLLYMKLGKCIIIFIIAILAILMELY